MDWKGCAFNLSMDEYQSILEKATIQANHKLDGYSLQISIGNYATAQRFLDEYLQIMVQIGELKEMVAIQSSLNPPTNHT